MITVTLTLPDGSTSIHELPNAVHMSVAIAFRRCVYCDQVFEVRSEKQRFCRDTHRKNHYKKFGRPYGEEYVGRNDGRFIEAI